MPYTKKQRGYFGAQCGRQKAGKLSSKEKKTDWCELTKEAHKQPIKPAKKKVSEEFERKLDEIFKP